MWTDGRPVISPLSRYAIADDVRMMRGWALVTYAPRNIRRANQWAHSINIVHARKAFAEWCETHGM